MIHRLNINPNYFKFPANICYLCLSCVYKYSCYQKFKFPANIPNIPESRQQYRGMLSIKCRSYITFTNPPLLFKLNWDIHQYTIVSEKIDKKKMFNIKKISGYPENAISWAMDKLPSNERAELNKTLNKIEGFLGEKPKKEATRKLPSITVIFEQHILIEINKTLRKLEKLEDKGKIFEVNESISSLSGNFQDLSLDELAKLHKKVVEYEDGFQTVSNFLKYYRGLVYLTVHGKCDDSDGLQRWIAKEDVSKSTVYRYMAFSALIMRFPRLILCNLNFSQILKHKERILAFMSRAENSKIAHQLSETVEFRIGATTIEINSKDDGEIPHIRGISFTPDWRILDNYEDNTDISGISSVSTEGAVGITDQSCKEVEKVLKQMSVESYI